VPTITLHRLPAWLPMSGITLGRHVFVKEANRDLILVHELVHVAQQERDGWLRFYLRWLCSDRWRVRYESEAYAADFKTGRYSMEPMARTLAGWLYWWPTSRWLAEAAIRRWL
jgi:hypothetical protein